MSVQPPYPGFRPSFETCTDVTPYCPVSITTYGDYFNLGACIFFVVLHALMLAYQLFLAQRYRTWTFSVFLALGTAIELMGYCARIVMTPIGTVWNYSAFCIQLVMLILGPTFVAAAISVTFKWIVIQCGERYSLIKPKWYPWIFLGTDFTSIIIQAIGGAVSAVAADGAGNSALLDVGSGLLIAGTAFQAANMVFCGLLIVVFGWRYYRARVRGDYVPPAASSSAAAKTIEAGESRFPSPESSGAHVADSQAQAQSSPNEPIEPFSIKPNTRFRMFMWAILVAYMAIIVRCCYRIPEMANGWGSDLMQNETLFLIFDGSAIAFAVLTLTIFHPALFFPVMRKAPRSERKAAKRAAAEDKARREADVESAAPA